MNRPALIVFTMTATFAGAAVVACASDESDPLVAPDAESKIPGLDGGGAAEPSDDGGDAGAAGEPCPPDALCPNGVFDPDGLGPQSPSGPGDPGGLDVRTRITLIRGRSASDVWAAGANGTILHFDGTSWSRSDPGTDNTINALWLHQSGEVALSSLKSAAYTRGFELDAGADADAGSSSPGGWMNRGIPAAPPPLRNSFGWLTSAWTTPGADWLWCTTMEGPPDQGNDTANGLWRLHVAPATGSLAVGEAAAPRTCAIYPCRQMMNIHGASADDLWAVGIRGATVHITNAQGDTPKLTPFDSQTWSTLHGVWAASESEAWAVGSLGVIRHYTRESSSWEIVSDVPTTATLRAVWGSSRTDVWAVGDDAVVIHYDGTAWSQVKVAGLGSSRPALHTVWTPGPGRVWAAGEGVVLSLGGKP